MITKKENEILKILILFFLLVTGSYFIFPLAKIKGFAEYLSGFSTVGIFVLTSFYVLYTNRQIKELQKQRQLQIQPLPNIEISESHIEHPRIVADLFENTDFSFRVDLSFKIKLKNIGNGAAILVDIFNKFVGLKITDIEEDSIYALRINTCEEKNEISFSFGEQDKNLQMLKALHTTPTEGCAAKSAFDVLLRTNVFYRNVLSTPFLLTIDHLIIMDGEKQKIISDWFTIMSSYKTRHASTIAKIKSVWQRDKEEAWDLFSDLANTVNSEFKEEKIKVHLLPHSSSFHVKNLSKNEAESLSNKIYHGIPIGIGKSDEEDDSELPVQKDENSI